MQQPAQNADRRRAERKSVALAAWIRLEQRVCLACVVRDISPMGAGIELAYDAFVPLQFQLQVPNDLFEVDCRLRRRHGLFIGVEFISSRAEAMARYGSWTASKG